MRRIALWLAVLLALPFVASAAPSVSGPTPGGGGTWYEWTVKFDGTTADSRAMALTPTQCSFTVNYSGSGSVQLWQVSDPGDAASTGAQVGSTISSQPDEPSTFSPGRSHVKAVASVASSGTVMTIRCSNTQVSASGGGTTDFTQPSPSLGTEAGGLVYNATDPATVEYGYGSTWGNSGGSGNETNNLLGPYYNKESVNAGGCENQFEHAFDISWEMSYNDSATDDQTWVEENWDVYPARNYANVSGLSGGFAAAVDVGDTISFGGSDTGIVTAWANPQLTWIQNAGIAEASDTVTIDGETATLGTITADCVNAEWRPYLAIWDTVDNFASFTWDTTSDGDQRDTFQVKNGGIAIGADTSPNGTGGPRLLVEGTQAGSAQAQIRFDAEDNGSYSNPRTLDIFMDLSADNAAFSNNVQGIYIDSVARGTGSTHSGGMQAIWIEDLHNGTAQGSSSDAIYVVAQTPNAGSQGSQHGNIRMAGGNWNNGHLVLGLGTGQGNHMWFNATDDVFHMSSENENMLRPLSESDGGLVLTGEKETSPRICDERQWSILDSVTGTPSVGDTLTFTGGAGGTATVTDFANPYIQWSIDTGSATVSDSVSNGSGFTATLLTLNTFQKPEGYVFYNDTSDYYCFCNGSGNDVQMHSPATACF